MAHENKRVLIADDEEHVRLMIKGVLNTMQCNVVGEAASGRETTKAYMALRPDLVLLDIDMPDMTGIEVLKDIRSLSEDVTIIMLTSMVDSETVDECINAGASRYLRKDTPLEEIRATLVQCGIPMKETDANEEAPHYEPSDDLTQAEIDERLESHRSSGASNKND